MSRPSDHRPRRGSAIEHGPEHFADHQRWSRRNFLQSLGVFSLGAPVALGRSWAKPSSGLLSKRASSLLDLETDRVLVLLQIKGGWDGLNIVVPISEQSYHDARPNLRVDPASTFSLSDEFGLRTELSDLIPMWNDGKMGVLHGVGYPDSTLSHFEGTDNWISASPYHDDRSGWIGRTLGLHYPDISENPLEAPLAVEISSVASRLFYNDQLSMGMTLRNPEEFYNIAQTGGIYDPSSVPDDIYGEELSFLRQVANFTVQYSDTIQQAALLGANDVSYPDTDLGEKLAIVARLVKGGLGSKVYTVQLDGFDTHGFQNQRLPVLLENMGSVVQSFFEDLAQSNQDEKTLLMTFSEFGRRVNENASLGTDHGTSAPIFVFGGQDVVRPGLHGQHPNLDQLDDRGNLEVTTDFRSVYGTILSEWLGVECEAGSSILDFRYENLNLIMNPEPGIGTCSLPVELSSFVANFNGDDAVDLHWTTDSELNNSGFEIELLYLDSASSQFWKKVGFVEGNGTSIEKHEYTFSAKIAESGNYRFRLKQIDFGGGFEYSQRVEVFVELPSDASIIEFYPNPLTSRGVLKVKMKTKQVLRIDLFDQLGRQVKEIFHDQVQDNSTLELPLSAQGLANGSYVLLVSGESTVGSTKIIVRR